MSKYHDPKLEDKLNVIIPVKPGDLVRWIPREFEPGHRKHRLRIENRSHRDGELYDYERPAKKIDQIFLVLGYVATTISDKKLGDYGNYTKDVIKVWLLHDNEIVYIVFDPYPSTNPNYNHPFPFVRAKRT